jgi:hypothetical protein
MSQWNQFQKNLALLIPRTVKMVSMFTMGIVRLRVIANRRILMEKQVQMRAEIERAKTWRVKRSDRKGSDNDSQNRSDVEINEDIPD